MLRDAATCQENYQRFIERVVASGHVWILSGDSGAAFCESNDEDGVNVVLLFSDAAYAARVQKQAIPDHQPEQLALFDLFFRWLPGMSEDGVLAGPNWTGDLVGLEVDPIELRKELERRLSPEQRSQLIEQFKKAKSEEA